MPAKQLCQCVICGAEFRKSPSKRQVTCTWECANKLRSKSKTTHGGYGTRLYRIYNLMKSRCDVDGENERYAGLPIHPEWQQSFESFRDWAMSNGYSDDLEIDRKENEKGYTPDNCRWATRQQQSQNRRRFSTKQRSRFKGVQPINNSSRWQANARHDGRDFYLGAFDTEAEAARAYDAWAAETYGEYACLNFPVHSEAQYLTSINAPDVAERAVFPNEARYQ